MAPPMSSGVPTLSAGIVSFGKTPSPMIPAARSDGKTVDVNESESSQSGMDGKTYVPERRHWP